VIATNSELKPCDGCDGRGEVGGMVWYGSGEGGFETQECPFCRGTGKDSDSEAHHEE